MYEDIGRDLMLGEDGNDQFFSIDGGDSMSGGHGKNWLLAGGDQSALDGGAGHDFISLFGESTVTGGEGSDILTYMLAPDTPDNLALTLTDFDPTQDHLWIFVEGLTSDDPQPALRLVDWAEGTGADLMLGYPVVARLVGLEAKDHAAILDRVGIGIEPAEVVIHDGAQSSTLNWGGDQGPDLWRRLLRQIRR